VNGERVHIYTHTQCGKFRIQYLTTQHLAFHNTYSQVQTQQVLDGIREQRDALVEELKETKESLATAQAENAELVSQITSAHDEADRMTSRMREAEEQATDVQEKAAHEIAAMVKVREGGY
jgi:uncharacterized coiled-coil DUF342 family protein